MKVAVFTDIYAPWSTGGIASSVRAQKDALETLGHEVTIFCPGFGAKEAGVVNVPSYRFLRLNGAVVARPPKVTEKYILEKFPNFQEFDVVHVHHELFCSTTGVRLAKKFDVPLVQTMHGREDMAIEMNVPRGVNTVLATALNSLHSKLLPHGDEVKRDKFQAPTVTRAKMWSVVVNHAENADVVIVPTHHFARKLEHYGMSRPIAIVSNGIAKELVDEEFAVRRMEDGDAIKMVWNCRVSKEKRIMSLLRALRLLRRPYILHVYGDGNELKKAQKYSKKYGLKVKFYGRVERKKIIKRMQESHLGVTVSYNFDVQAMTLLEAEATGLPVFFCDPDMVEVVPKGSYVLSDGPDSVAMAATLDNIQTKQIQKMSEVMLKNREGVLQEAQIKELLKAYNLAKKEHEKKLSK